jgi:phage baseplate assembly protein W
MSGVHIGFPLRWDATGRTAMASDAAWVRGLIEQLLFTAPGERVMRPDFGTGLNQLAFAPGSAELAAAVHVLVQGALHRWLSDLIEIAALDVTSVDAELRVILSYRLLADGSAVTDTFALPTGAAA